MRKVHSTADVQKREYPILLQGLEYLLRFLLSLIGCNLDWEIGSTHAVHPHAKVRMGVQWK